MRIKSFFYLRNLIVSFVLFICMYFLINHSPFGVDKLVEITGGHGILDMEMGGYSADRAYEILEALGEEGRAFNMKYIVPLDFPFPLSYGLFYFMTLTLIMKNIRKRAKRPWIAGSIGLAAALFDWLENIMIINLLRNYPQRLDGVAKIASVLTQLKTLFLIISTLLVIVGLLFLMIKRLNRKKEGVL